MMLCEIYRALDIDGSFNPEIIEEALSSDHYWAIDWEYPGVSTGEDTPKKVSFFVDTYDMYSILEYTYERLSDEDKLEVSSSVEGFNEEYHLKFPGFDGNNETEFLSIGRTLKVMGRFSGSEDLVKNSHSPSVEKYQRMLKVFLPARSNSWTHGVGISKEDLIKTLNEKVHPSNR